MGFGLPLHLLTRRVAPRRVRVPIVKAYWDLLLIGLLCADVSDPETQPVDTGLLELFILYLRIFFCKP